MQEFRKRERERERYPKETKNFPVLFLGIFYIIIMSGGSKPNEKKIELKIKAWEDREKIKADNKAERKIASADAWQITKKAALEAEVKKMEAGVEKMRLKGMEKLKNKEAQTDIKVESKKATIQVRRDHDKQKVEEKAAKHRSSNTIPTKCFGVCQD